MNTQEKEALKKVLENTSFITPALLKARLNVNFIKAMNIIRELSIACIISKPKEQYTFGLRQDEYGMVKYIEKGYVCEVCKELIWAVDMLWNEL